ncbi:hypothetical protein SIID45300_00489 [Candidatus Magnetaquicoccaceae bacterium FCR-1]|uniref:Secreted protein n=1 Tax=Candidatus Magnetaquiglobus chichijimensis TaxID=3141448 RepID=A0ABQ0C5L5_9PROT
MKSPSPSVTRHKPVSLGSLLLGTGLTLTALILIPAMAQRWGVGAGLTGALRVAATRAAQKV